MNAAINVGSSIYFDANALIYYVERDDELQRKVGAVVVQALSARTRLFVSEMGIAECLYGTYKSGREKISDSFQKLFYSRSVFEVLPVSGKQIIAAAKLGAEKGLKLVDAVHFLAAMESRCEIFITNDQRFQSSHGIKVLQLRDL